MTDPGKKPSPDSHRVQFTSEEFLEIREEDTQPGKPSERHRQWMREKWGKKAPPPNEHGKPKE